MDPEFLQFYSAYPRHEARKDAYKAWQQTKDVRPPLPELLDAIKRAIVGNNWTPDRKQFVPLPATWLRGERWTDEFEVNLPTAQQIEQASRHWSETAAGIEAKGKELGMRPDQFEHFPAFKSAVMAAAREH